MTSHSRQWVSEHKPRHEVQGIVGRPPRQDCIKEQIQWARVQKNLCSIEVSKTTTASIICKSKKFKTNRPLPTAKRQLKDSQTMRNNILWSVETKIELFDLNPKCHCLEETRHSSSIVQYFPYSEAGWWKHHLVGCSSPAGSDRWVRVEGKINAAMHKDILDDNLPHRPDLELGWLFNFLHDTDPKQAAKITKEWLCNHSVNVLEWSGVPTLGQRPVTDPSGRV